MSEPTPIAAERLIALADAYLLGELDAEQLAELEHELNRSSASRKLFATVTDHAAAMREAFGNATDQLVEVEDDQSDDFFSILSALDSAEETGPVDRTAEIARRNRAAKQQSRRDAFRARQQASGHPRNPLVIPNALVWLGMAAVLGLIAWIGWPRGGAAPPAFSPTVQREDPKETSPSERPVYVARVKASAGARWEGAMAAGARLQSGQTVILHEGFAELVFDDGTEVLIEGPATFQPTGPRTMQWVDGRFSAVVPASGERFEVVTAHTRVTAQGSAFGLDLPPRSDAMLLHVFTGEVGYQRVASAQGAIAERPRNVAENTTLAIGAGRDPVAATPDRPFVRELPSRYELAVREIDPVGFFRFAESRSDATPQSVAGESGWTGQYLNRVDRRVPGFDAQSPGRSTNPYAIGFGSGRGGSARLPDPPEGRVPVGAYTYAFWVRPGEHGQRQCVFLRTGADGPLIDVMYQVSITPDGRLQHYVFTTSTGYQHEDATRGTRTSQFGQTRLTPGRWHHVVVTATDRGELRLYVDGEPDAAPVEVPGLLLRDGTELLIASTARTILPDGGDGEQQGGYRGDFDDLAIFDRVLSQRQVRDLYQAGAQGAGAGP
ncbi:LamG domain-containing protein [Phycisphaeraceae bacterium D3-23]